MRDLDPDERTALAAAAGLLVILVLHFGFCCLGAQCEVRVISTPNAGSAK